MLPWVPALWAELDTHAWNGTRFLMVPPLQMPVSDKKREFGKRLISLLTTSRAVLIVTADNVGSKQIQDVRRGLRGDATMLMGKNVSVQTTRICRIVSDRVAVADDYPPCPP